VHASLAFFANFARFPFANFAVKVFDPLGKSKAITAKDAENFRKVAIKI
jgi:hypothetical protein